MKVKRHGSENINILKATGVINSIFKPSLVQKHARLQVYKTLARPVLSYGSEAWTNKKADEKRHLR
jgi:hypothetical protein